MGDVVTALGRAVQEEDHDVMVVLPKYDVLNYEEVRALRSITWSPLIAVMIIPRRDLITWEPYQSGGVAMMVRAAEPTHGCA